MPRGEGGRKKKYQGGGSSSILPAEKMEGEGFFVHRAEKVEDGGFGASFFGAEPLSRPPPSPSDLRPILRGRRSKMEILRSSAPKIED